MKAKSLVVLVVTGMIIAGFGGCMKKQEEIKSTGMPEPELWFVFKEPVVPGKQITTTDKLIVIEKIPELAVITAPLSARHTLIKTENQTTSVAEVTPVVVYANNFSVDCIVQQLSPQQIITVGNVPLQGENIEVNDLTEASLKIAEMLENPEKTAFIFNEYSYGLAAVPLASYLNAPLIYAKKLEDVKGKLAGLNITKFITLGFRGGDKEMLKIKDVQEYFLNILAERGDYCDYIVVANTYDIEIEHKDNRFPQDCMSMSAASLAAFRKALIAVVEFEPDDAKWNNTEQVEEVKDAIVKARILVLTHGMVPHYICLVGDPKMIPMKYYTGCGTGEWAEEAVPTDNYYADFDGNPFTQEMSIGRIVGRDVGDASALVARSAGYQRMVELEKAKGGLAGTDINTWIKNAYFLEGTLLIELFSTGDVVAVNKMLTEGGFITKFRHSAVGALSSQNMDIYDNNYIIYYGHGGDDGWYYFGIGGGDAVRVGPEDLEGKIIPPGNGIAGSCLTSALDDMSEYAKSPIDKRISLAFLRAGAVSYVGGTRVTWGEVKVWPVLESSCNGMLCNRYIENLVRFNQTLGDSLMIAKNEYYKMASNMNRTVIYIDNNFIPHTYHGLTPWDNRTMLAYPLYGDPAVNPYEYRATDIIFG